MKPSQTKPNTNKPQVFILLRFRLGKQTNRCKSIIRCNLDLRAAHLDFDLNIIDTNTHIIQMEKAAKGVSACLRVVERSEVFLKRIRRANALYSTIKEA